MLQRFHGNAYGSPWTPRIGDLVLMIFLADNFPIVIGNLVNIYQEPVCRPNSTDPNTGRYGPCGSTDVPLYDIVYKISHWEEPRCTSENEFNYTDHPYPRDPPVCAKYFDCTRDCVIVHTCPHGYEGADPTCENCSTIDYIDAGTYLKVLGPRQYYRGAESARAQSKIDPEWRVKFHHHCGSIKIYDEDGTIHEENKVAEDPRGHIHFDPTGTIDVHSEPQENKGAIMRVVADEDNLSDEHGLIAAELTYLPKMATVRIYKDGSIRIRSGDDGSEVFLGTNGNCWMWNILEDAYIEFSSGGDCEIKADHITLNGNVSITGGLSISGDINC